MSYRLTCSLASLIVLLMIGLYLPVGAQEISVKQEVLIDIASAINSFPASEAGKDMKGFVVYGDGATAAAIGSTMTEHYWTAGTTPVNMLPNLEDFFRFGGTLELLANLADPTPADATNHDKPEASSALKMKDIVISEIMWALDGVSDDKQWIELYNTTGKAIGAAEDADSPGRENLGSGDLAFLFTPFVHLERLGNDLKSDHTVTTVAADKKWKVIDTVSNLQFVRWDLPGQNGNSIEPRVERALDPPVSPLISAYRNIDYVKIHGIHKITPQNLPSSANRAEQLKGVPNGWLQGSWKATQLNGRRNTQAFPVGSNVTTANVVVATLGHTHVMDVVFAGVTKTPIPSNSVVINEVRNDTSSENVDWVELYNAGTEAVDLHDWELSLVHKGSDGKLASSKTDTMLVGKEDGQTDEYRFPKGEDWRFQPGAYLLIVNRHPSQTPLANGVNIDEVIAGKDVKAGAMHEYIVREKLDLPSNNITLLLRNALDKNSHHKGDNVSWDSDAAYSEKLMDYAGNVSIAVHTNPYNTLVWPFKAWTQTADTDGKDGESIPHKRTQAHARKRYQENDGHHKDAWDQVDAQGGVGYDRGVDMKYAPGTPGYANDSMRNALIDNKNTSVTTDDIVYTGEISISEVMYDAGPRWNLIQWIELYNSSMTETVNLKDWEMEIHNATSDVESYVDSNFIFNDAYILPNQTLLIVSGTATNDVAANRVYNLFQHHRRRLGLTNRRSTLFSPDGFYIELTDKNDDMVDEAGNLEIGRRERTILWELPPRNVDMRQSLVRQYGSRELYDGTPESVDLGLMETSWRKSDLEGAGIAFYGHRDDVGTPGYRLGGPLPVQLSKFRPARDENTGHVVVRWITESELNNAGFNILRSESKTGEFKVVNVKGIIAGHGTTSEKHVYEWTDTTAKPNVVYYYQIEDVSLNGHRTTLTTTRLKGHISASGKLTTRWSELKSTR